MMKYMEMYDQEAVKYCNKFGNNKYDKIFYYVIIKTKNQKFVKNMTKCFSTIAGFGGVLVPHLMARYPDKEQIAVSILAMIVCQLIWLLPASLNQPLPSTIEEAESLQSRDNKCISI